VSFSVHSGWEAARPRYIVTPRSRFTGCAKFNVSRNALGTA
jgi:hypothetical protein